MAKRELTHIKDITSLKTIITEICKKIGLLNIESGGQYIIKASHMTALGKKHLIFFCTLSELNGKLELLSNTLKKVNKNNDDVIIVSSNPKKISKFFKDWIKTELETDKIDFWDEKKIISLVSDNLPEYWGHNDVFLKSFEDSFINKLESNGELQQVLKLDKKFEELLNIFIEPKIHNFETCQETGRTIKKRFHKKNYLNGENYFISGEAGTGKSTLLKEIGRAAISSNKDSISKTLPLKLKTSQISDSKYSLNDAIVNEIDKLVGKDNVDKVFGEYHVLLLIDSIDEFEDVIRFNLIKELNEITHKNNSNFIITTRNYDKLTKDISFKSHVHTIISNFDLHQVQNYLNTFFKTDLGKSEELWNSLIDNKILDKIPSTPLTISLISVLFEENGYEVPATVTDVYDNFNTFLLGKLNVNSNLDFLKIDLKQKILQMYALKIIKNKNRNRLKKEEFIEYIITYFESQSITIEEEIIPDIVKSLTDGTGILFIDEEKNVTYLHDHFMEYYASREIFDDENRNELEKEIIEKFCSHNWQNTAIFYTGRTKNMQKFLIALIDRIQGYTKIHEQLLAISGLGYVLQSLWMTNSEYRKEGVLVSLELLLKVDRGVKELAEKDFPFFKGIKNTQIALMNLVWFFQHYNSITLKDPLELAFNELHSNMLELKDTKFDSNRISRLYKLFCIASTLNTGRVQNTDKLQILFDEDKILNEPLFVYLFDEAISILEFKNSQNLRIQNKIKSKKKKYITGIRYYLNNSSDKLIHSRFDRIKPIKNVEIYTEGKTDASIIQHAFSVLTMNIDPYWNITCIENAHDTKGGGAQQLSSYLQKLSDEIQTDFDKNKVIIGVFDNDAKGYQEFNGLKSDFKQVDSIKKISGDNIYALLLPIPKEKDQISYNQEKQAFKFFEIEHYFSLDFLNENKMVNKTSIPGVYEIVGAKSEFNKKILNNFEYKTFKNFINLFLEIDKICNKVINYIEE